MELERNGIRTRRGHVHWSLGSLQKILKNQVYIGIDTFVDKKTELKIRNTIPQIISNKLWDIVQETIRLKLLRKGQLNRTTHKYLFRDFMYCSCGTPIGGRIKHEQTVKQYYCPLSERKFNKSVDDGKVCTMKKCMNIPTTEKLLWERIFEVLSNTVELKDKLLDVSRMDGHLGADELEQCKKDRELKMSELTRKLAELENGLVKVETEYLLDSYPSVEVYKSIKKDLNKKYNRTKVEIEDLRNSLTTLEDRNMWIQWIERFGNEMRDKKQISESSKYEILRGVLREIIVSYDHEKQVHMFTINFNIPIFMEDKSGKNSLRQKSNKSTKTCFPVSLPNSDLTYYSTVTDFAKLRGLSTSHPRRTAI